MQLKARTRLIGESRQEFAATVEQLADRALVGEPADFMQWEGAHVQMEVAHAFVDRKRGREVKQHLTGGDRPLNEALNQALKIKAAKAAAGPPTRLQEVTSPHGTSAATSRARRYGGPVCWHYGNAGHLSRDCRKRTDE